MVDRRAYDPDQPVLECPDCDYSATRWSHPPTCPDCGGSVRTASTTR